MGGNWKSGCRLGLLAKNLTFNFDKFVRKHGLSFLQSIKMCRVLCMFNQGVVKGMKNYIFATTSFTKMTKLIMLHSKEIFCPDFPC